MARKLKEAMKRRDLVALTPEATALDAARVMKEGQCGSVLIMVDDRLEGIATERDVIYRVVAEGRDPAATPLADIMTTDPDTIGPDDTVLEALRLMEDGGYRHLPVVDKGRVVGVVSRRDFYGDEKARLEDERRLWETMG